MPRHCERQLPQEQRSRASNRNTFSAHALHGPFFSGTVGDLLDVARPGKSPSAAAGLTTNDHVHVAQRSWVFVRRCAGYIRHDTHR